MERKLTDPRKEIRDRKVSPQIIDPRQSELEIEAKRLEASLTKGLAIEDDGPTPSELAEAEYKEKTIVTPASQPVTQAQYPEVTAQELERQAKANLERAAAIRKQQEAVKNPDGLYPDQEVITRALLNVFKWFISKGLDPDAATAMVGAYSRIELSLAIRAGHGQNNRS